MADSGYGAGPDLAHADKEQLAVLAHPLEGKPAKDNPYAAQHFWYDPQSHSVVCPQGQLLDHEGHTHRRGMRVERFRCHCRDCPVRDQCSKDPKGRQLEVWPFTPVVQAMRHKLSVSAMAACLSKRGGIVERCFGHIKQHDGFRRWTMWGLQAAQAQWAMVCTTMNLRILYKRWRTGRSPKNAGTMAMAGHWTGRIKANRAFQIASSAFFLRQWLAISLTDSFHRLRRRTRNPCYCALLQCF